MTSKSLRVLLMAGAVFATSACNKAPGTAADTTKQSEPASTGAAKSNDPIASAEFAAPAAIAHDAAVATVDANGAMKQLRAGKNGWTCMPDHPTTPGPDPMCMDANAAKWVAAWVGHKAPPQSTVGVIYMLAGGTDFSNTDPYAKAPSADNAWVKTGPHIMVVGSKEILAGHPSGATPDTSVPYVMWAGTPYAHLMVPTAPAS